jgi:hypothetical protein
MANTTIQIKKSATPAATPSSLANGELAINYADGKLFYKAANGTIVAFSTSDGNNFGTVNANGTLLVSDTTGDVFTMVPGNNITIVGDAVNDKVTIGLTNDVTITNLTTFKGEVLIDNMSGAGGSSEGGELHFAIPTSGSTLNGPIAIDIYENKMRLFETTGTNRGVYIDFTAAGGGVGTNLLSSSGGTTDTTARATAEAAFAKANAALPNTNGVTFAGTLTISANLNADKVISSNNGLGENFKVGDDAWIGDTNVADTIRIKGQQNPFNGYIAFGNNDGFLLGRSGSGNLTYGGNTIWHSGIDGAGSGLDADLLDGQHGSYYSGIGSAAFDRANSAQTIAVAAFTKANTGGGGGASVAISDVAPSSPTANSLWWSSDLGKMFIYYNDGSSNQWVETSPSPDVSGVATAVTISGLAYNAANLAVSTATAAIIPITPDTTGSADQYITFTGNTSGNLSGANIDYGLKFNPTGNVLNVSGVVRDSKGDVRDIPIYSVVVGYALGLSDTGETVSTNTTIYVPNATFGAGNTVSVYNNSSSSITITQNSGVTMYLGGTSTTGNRTLAQRGLATIYCVAANTFVIGGLGIS